MIDVALHVLRLQTYVEKASYAGYDPYDALNSPVLRLLGSTSKWVRIAFTQTLRRAPVNLRPLLGIRKGHNPKALGLFLWGYSKLYALEKDPRYLQRIDYLLDRLNLLRSEGYAGNCWGYNFDWQSGTCFRPKGTPTIVNTAFIGHALLDCYRFTDSQRPLDMAVETRKFILRDLHRTACDDTFCLSYTPVDHETVHNANMLGASLLIRLMKYVSDPELHDAAMASLAYTMRHQHEGGFWYYADRRNQQWVDSFHTGFVLQALRYFFEEGHGCEYRRAYEEGVRYYATHFFLENGTPKYYDTSVYPVDIHCPAQAIVFFSRAGAGYAPLADRVLAWMLENMWDADGYFWFRKSRFHTNRIPYMRWSQAWAFHALTEYRLQKTPTEEEENGVGS